MKFRMHRAARQELAEAYERYEADQPGLGRRFAREVAVGIGQVLAFPTAWQRVELGLRRYRLRDFPYGLVYDARKDEIVFLAVMHLSRQPGYWRNRT